MCCHHLSLVLAIVLVVLSGCSKQSPFQQQQAILGDSAASEKERLSAIKAIAQFGRDSIPVLQSQLRDENASCLRLAAIAALARIGQDGIPVLVYAMNDSKREFRDATWAELEDVGLIPSVLEDAAVSSFPDIRRRAIEAAPNGELPPHWLLDLCADHDAVIATCAVLRTCEYRKMGRQHLQQALTNGQIAQQCRPLVEEYLEKATVFTALKSDCADVRTKAIEILHSAPNNGSRSAGLAQSPYRDVQLFAIETCPTSDTPADWLVEFAASASDEVVATAAVNRLAKCGEAGEWILRRLMIDESTPAANRRIANAKLESLSSMQEYERLVAAALSGDQGAMFELEHRQRAFKAKRRAQEAATRGQALESWRKTHEWVTEMGRQNVEDSRRRAIKTHAGR